MAEVAAAARGIRHRYGAGEPVLRGVDLVVPGGALTALIGANGSGKTTLLRILAGILEPTAGTVRLPGGRRSGAADRRLLGYLSQDPALDPEMTCGEILTLIAALHGVRRRARRRRVADLAASFGIEPALGRRVDRLSGGQRRRLHVAAGMLHDPLLLCLDEPTAGLDPEGSALLWAELESRSRRGRATVIVTHDLAAAERHAAEVCFLDRGQIVAAGAPRELVAEHPPSLAEVYRRLTGRAPAALAPASRSPARRSPAGRGQGRRSPRRDGP